MTRSFVCFANTSKLNSKPQYSASFTVKFVAYSDAAATIVHFGSFHMIALYNSPFRSVRADPSKLATKRLSSSFIVSGGMRIICPGCIVVRSQITPHQIFMRSPPTFRVFHLRPSRTSFPPASVTQPPFLAFHLDRTIALTRPTSNNV